MRLTAIAEFLRRVKEGKARPGDDKDIWRAMQLLGLVNILGSDGAPLRPPIRNKDVAGFRLTRRGEDALGGAVSRTAMPTRQTQLWLSGLKRSLRNVPKGVTIDYDDHKLKIRDANGVIETIKLAS
jgi:hypothetical protein